MKKMIPFFICLLLCVPSFGQNLGDNQMSVSYGFFSNSKLYTVLSRIFGSVVAKDYKASDFGAMSFEYMHDLGDLVSVGVAMSYFHLSTFENGNSYEFNNYSLLPAAKLNWYRKPWFGSYTKVAAGASYRDFYEEKDRVYFNFQVSLLGLEVGPEFLRAYTEIGVGEQGALVAGLRYRF